MDYPAHLHRPPNLKKYVEYVNFIENGLQTDIQDKARAAFDELRRFKTARRIEDRYWHEFDYDRERKDAVKALDENKDSLKVIWERTEFILAAVTQQLDQVTAEYATADADFLADPNGFGLIEASAAAERNCSLVRNFIDDLNTLRENVERVHTKYQNHETKQKEYDYFQAWRRRRLKYGVHGHSARRDKWAAYPIPVKRPPPPPPGFPPPPTARNVTHWPGLDREEYRNFAPADVTVDPDWGPVGAGNNAIDRIPPEGLKKGDDARMRAQVAARNVRDVRSSMNFVRLLGWGGMGVACLFREGDWGDLFVVKTVLKASKWTEELMRDEIEIMKKFHGAQHIVQLKYPVGESGLFNMGTAGSPLDTSLMITEYCPRGTLDKLIVKSKAREYKHTPSPWAEPIYSRTLWLIFECLFRSIVGMQYPPGQWVPARAPGPDDPPVHEEIPRVDNEFRKRQGYPNHWPGSQENWVHFDIDPTNILVGSTDSSHPEIPIIKLNDFGCTQDMDAAQMPNKWQARQTGKAHLLAPEQFTSEWDWIEEDSVPPEAKIAGKYGWKTNLWGIGYTMWCLITKCCPPEAPLPELVPAEPGPNPRMAWSHGALVTEFATPYIDADLCNLVVRCMMDDPADRPEMREMERILYAKVRQQYPRGSTWAEEQTADLFREPRFHMQRSADELGQWMDDKIEIQEWRSWDGTRF